MKNKKSKKPFTHFNEEEIAGLIFDLASLSASMTYWLTVGPKAGEEASSAEFIRSEADNITDSIKNIFSKTEDVVVASMAREACDAVWEAAALAVSLIESEIDEDDLGEEDPEQESE